MRPHLTYFLLCLMTLQSMFSIADAHQSHQQKNTHLSFDSHQHENATHSHTDADLNGSDAETHDLHKAHQYHSHADAGTENFTDKSSETNPTKSQWDCHHCCHCHGHSSHMLVAPVALPSAAHINTLLLEYSKQLLPQHFNPLLRPPIA